MALRQRHLLVVVAVILGLGFGYIAAVENNYRDARIGFMASILAFAIAFFALFGRGGRR